MSTIHLLRAAVLLAVAVSLSACYSRVDEHPAPVAVAPAPVVVTQPAPTSGTVVVKPY
jgi:uncharacterized lipoprotein YbaY